MAKKASVYSLEMLLNDIQDYLDADNGEDIADGEAKREQGHKLIVMQMLLFFAMLYRGEDYSDDMKLLNAITVKVDNDELLSGFLFYISRNPQFDYSWSYMRKRKSSYIAFLAVAVRFLNNVVADINNLAGKPRMGNDIHVVFNDVIDVAFTTGFPLVKASLLWENFNHLAMVKKDYSVSVKRKDNVLIAGTRKEPMDAGLIYDGAMEIAKNSDSETEQ